MLENKNIVNEKEYIAYTIPGVSRIPVNFILPRLTRNQSNKISKFIKNYLKIQPPIESIHHLWDTKNIHHD